MESSKWNFLWLIPWTIISTLAVELCLFLPLFILGIPLTCIAMKWAPMEVGFSPISKASIFKYSWRWLDEWIGNREDGICPMWWKHDNPDSSFWKLGVTWFLRNPVNNMRFWPLISTIPDSKNVKFIGSDTSKPDGIPCWFFAWQKGFAGFRYQTTSKNFWFGWKIKPEDRFGLPKDSYRNWGIGIAIQFNNAQK